MPETLGLLALSIFQAGGPMWLANALVGVGPLAGIFSAVGQIALSVGISAIGTLLSRNNSRAVASATKPDDVQQSIRVAISDRVKIYGQMQASGNWVFGDSKNGDLHKVLVVCDSELVEMITLRIDDNTVAVDGSGNVTTAPYVGYARFQYTTGVTPGPGFPALTSVFPEWDAAHRGDGVVLIYATQYAVEAEKLTQIFPAVKDTLYRIEGRWSKVYNCVAETTAWSDNAIDIIRDFVISDAGLRLPASVVNTPHALEIWKRSRNRADENVTLKAGGTEKRYRLWGAYKLSEAPGAVFESMLSNSDARPILTRDGGIAVDVTEYYEPTVLLDKSVITAVTSVTRGVDVRSATNIVTSKYLSVADGYQLVEAEPWENAESVAARGALPSDAPFQWSPSHSQARRLMKRRLYQLNPEWQLTVTCRIAAAEAFQERFVAVDYTIGKTRIFGAFEVLKFSWNIGENGVLKSVSISLRSIDPAAFDWNAAEEEGTAAVTEYVSNSNIIPAVAGFDVTVGRRIISGSSVAYSVVDFDEPSSKALIVKVQGKKTADSNWIDINIPTGAIAADGLLQDDGVEYEYRARYATLTGRLGSWTSPTIKITAVADVTAPSPMTLTSATGGAGNVTIVAVTPNSANFNRFYVYRNTVNNFETATRVKTVYGSPNTSYTVTDSGLAAGTYYYWLTAANSSAVESSTVATGSKTVT